MPGMTGTRSPTALTHVSMTLRFSAGFSVADSPSEPIGTRPTEPSSTSHRECFARKLSSTVKSALNGVVIAGMTPFQFTFMACTSHSFPYHAYRSGLKPCTLHESGSPDSVSAISLPVMGPRLTPIMAWPVATERLANRETRPT